MSAHPFLRDWQACFGDALPAGHLCREALADRWLRVHSLPGSKRYADTDAERVVLLHRHDAIAGHVLGEGEACAVFIVRFGEDTAWDVSETPPTLPTTPRHVLCSRVDGDVRQFFAAPVVWRTNAFDPLVLAIADERVEGVLFANLLRGSIYAPYDGGADLFFPSPQAALAARARFSSWLSARADGL